MPILVYDAKRGAVEVVCGLGVAPRLATRAYFTKKGGIPGSGIEAAAVPAVLDACLTTLDRYGTLLSPPRSLPPCACSTRRSSPGTPTSPAPCAG